MPHQSQTRRCGGTPDDEFTAGNICGADTCFALLFLKRSNLTPDLTRQIAGRLHDPGKHLLMSDARGEDAALEKPSNLLSGIEGKNTHPAVTGRYPDEITKSGEPPPLTKPLSKPDVPEKPRADRSTADKSLLSLTARMANDLASSTGSRFDMRLHNLRVGKGAEFTEALALALGKLKGERQQKVRETLVERLTRMKDTTLLEYLDDEQVEIRMAAARAAAV